MKAKNIQNSERYVCNCNVTNMHMKVGPALSSIHTYLVYVSEITTVNLLHLHNNKIPNTVF